MIKVDIEKGAHLEAEQIKDLRAEFSGKEFEKKLRYSKGENDILKRTIKDVNAPHNKIPISYARKIINTVVGYMYKPGLISYSSENDQYLDRVNEINEANDEEIKSSHIGKQASIQGVAYELHWVDSTEIIPRFSKLPANQVVPIYNYKIEPEMVCALWVYEKDKVEKIFAYYPDMVIEYEIPLDNQDREIREVRQEPHEYEDVPLVVYQNNEDELGDFEPVMNLIDAYDILASDSMNEFDRFAWAYLVLKGFRLDEENTKKGMLKLRRVLELTEGGEASFLTKDINDSFIQNQAQWFRHEIHRQSHVPDFLELGLGEATSGAAIDRMLYDFEFIAATKEALFKEGLQRRYQLINNILRKSNTKELGDEWKLDIHMARNKPLDLKQEAETMNGYAGHVSEETLLGEFAPFVKDPAEELRKVNKEKELDIERQQELFQGRNEQEST